jgi:hypothetical protein
LSTCRNGEGQERARGELEDSFESSLHSVW